MTDIKNIWKTMSIHDFGPEPIVIDVDDDDGKIWVYTMSCQNENGQDGLYVSANGDTLEEALTNFSIELDKELIGLDE